MTDFFKNRIHIQTLLSTLQVAQNLLENYLFLKTWELSVLSKGIVKGQFDLNAPQP